MPGGRVKMGEDTKSACFRELFEETGVVFKNAKLIYFAENFFNWQGANAHEILVIYKIKVSPKNKIFINSEFESLDNKNIFFRWVDKSKIKNINCKPVLIYELAKKSNGFKHSVGN